MFSDCSRVILKNSQPMEECVMFILMMWPNAIFLSMEIQLQAEAICAALWYWRTTSWLLFWKSGVHPFPFPKGSRTNGALDHTTTSTPVSSGAWTSNSKG